MHKRELKELKKSLQAKIDTIRLSEIVADAISRAVRLGVSCDDLVNHWNKLERMLTSASTSVDK